jgi:transcriptional regulator with XRE-family HTH domain
MAQVEEIYRRVGRAVAAWRSVRGLSQAQLAEAVGCDTSYIARIETGKRRVSLDKLDSIAAALRLPVSVLLGSNGDKPGGPSSGAEPDVPSNLGEAFQRLAASDIELLVAVAERLAR